MFKIGAAFWLSVPLAGLLALGACDRKAPDVQNQATDAAVSATANRSAELVAGSVVLEVHAGEERMQVSAGEKTDGKVTATGVAGALIFGPYVPLPPGKYALLVEGASTTPFAVDVVYSAGSKQVAVQEYDAPSGRTVGSGSLAVLDFEVNEAIENAEFRVVVPDGADTTVTAYKVVAR